MRTAYGFVIARLGAPACLSALACSGVAAAGGEADALRLTLAQCREMVLRQNLNIQARRLGWQASRYVYLGEWGAFEPAFVGSATSGKNERENTKEQELSQNSPFFYEENKEYNAGIETLLPLGGRLQFGYVMRDLYNNLRVSPSDPLYNEYEGFLGASVVQPLLKDAGLSAAMARIRLARTESEAAFQDFRKEMMTVLARAEAAYWNLCLAQEQERLRRESVTLAEKILADNEARVKAGKMSDLEVFQAQAGVAMRRTRASEAHLKAIEAMDQLRTFLAETAGASGRPVEAADRPAPPGAEPEHEASVRQALASHPDYLLRRHQADAEDIRLSFAQNQRWPQVDLKGSLGLNGLGRDSSEAWTQIEDGQYEAWSFGVEVRVPAFGDIKGRRELAAARHRKQQALIHLKEAEIEIVNGLDAAIRKVAGSREQAENYKLVADFSRRVLDTEMSRLDAGKSDSRKVLDVEDDLAEALSAEIESVVRHQTALLEYELAGGSLLRARQVEPLDLPDAGAVSPSRPPEPGPLLLHTPLR